MSWTWAWFDNDEGLVALRAVARRRLVVVLLLCMMAGAVLAMDGTRAAADGRTEVGWPLLEVSHPELPATRQLPLVYPAK